MNFIDYKITDIKKAMTNLIKKHKTIAEATQTMLFGIAYEIEAENDATELNRFVVQLSEVHDEKLVLSAVARAVGVYMQDILPVKWSRKEQAFIMDEELSDFDYTVALESMQAVRWDKYNQKSADSEFDADKTLTKAIAMINGIIKKHNDGDLVDDDPAFVRARRIAKAF